VTLNTAFDRVPLPSLPPGELTAERLDQAVRAWVTSPPVRALAEVSGWTWPDGRDTAGLLAELVRQSDDWDFRRRQERDAIGAEPARVNDRVIPDGLVLSAADALGLVAAEPAPDGTYSHLVVLSGLVRACVNRTAHAAHLLEHGLRAASTAVLGAHRALSDGEREQAGVLDLAAAVDEAEVILAAARRAFRLGEPLAAQVSLPWSGGWDPARQGASAWFRWKDAEVVIAPSAAPAQRRANTDDQLRYWAAGAGIGPADRVLLLTTQIYVPFQQLVGLRVLGLERGCAVACCGVDAATSVLPPATFGGRSYLQEVRSALRAAGELMAAAQRAGG
jgi:hypothetical protein